MDTSIPDHATIPSELNMVGCKRNSDHFYGGILSLHLPKKGNPKGIFSVPHHEPSYLHELRWSHNTLYDAQTRNRGFLPCIMSRNYRHLCHTTLRALSRHLAGMALNCFFHNIGRLWITHDPANTAQTHCSAIGYRLQSTPNSAYSILHIYCYNGKPLTAPRVSGGT